jgi:hypothetical protein
MDDVITECEERYSAISQEDLVHTRICEKAHKREKEERKGILREGKDYRRHEERFIIFLEDSDNKKYGSFLLKKRTEKDSQNCSRPCR